MSRASSRRGGRQQDDAGSKTRSSRRRQDDPAPARASSKSRRSPPDSRRHAKQAPASAQRSDSRRSAASSRAERGKAGQRARREPKTWKDHLPLMIGGLLLILVLIGLMSIPAIRRSMAMTAIDEAPDVESALSAWEHFATLVGGNPQRLSVAYARRLGPAEARIAFARDRKLFVEAMNIATPPDQHPDIRIQALQAACDILLADRSAGDHARGIVNSRIVAWVTQEDADIIDQDLAVAALRLLAIFNRPIADEEVAMIMLRLIREPGTDAVIRQAAIRELHRVIDRGNVGHVIHTMTTPHGSDMIADRGSPSIVSVAADHASPSDLDSVFALLSYDDNPRAQAAGLEILRGSGMASRQEQMDDAQRERSGQQVASYITSSVLNDKPEVFNEALRAVQSLRLTGARDQLFAMMGEIPPGSEAATIMASTLGTTFINTRTDESLSISEEIIRSLATAVADANKRPIAVAALKQVRERNLAQLRSALEALIATGDEDAFEAAMHIVGNLYQRQDVIRHHGNSVADIDNWRQALAEDRAEFQAYQAAIDWYNETQPTVQRASDGRDNIRAARERCQQEMARLEAWVSGERPVPLGLETAVVQRALRAFRDYFMLLQRSHGMDGLQRTEDGQRPSGLDRTL